MLEEEIKTFNRLLFTLLPEFNGKWVVIRHNMSCGEYDTKEEALEHGYKYWGIHGFIVGQLLEKYRRI